VTFKPVSREKAFLRVAAQISEAIERGDYAVGEMLPSERRLCEQMEVSRPVMREAMSALQLTGIVKTRAGLGSFVANSGPHASAPRIWTLAEEQSPAEVMETRLILEPAVARLAATRLTETNVSSLGRIVEQMRALAGEVADAKDFGSLDLQFHQAVADASGNDVIARFMRAVIGYANQRLWRSMRERSYQYARGLSLVYLKHHESTFSHLTKGDAAAAAESMLLHLTVSQSALDEDWEAGKGGITRGPVVSNE
jgi:GntR family transcriptional regulator, transcriptional repressor for pyruvate dehydrogenase complex